MGNRLAAVSDRRAAIGDRRYSSTGILPVLGHGRDGQGTLPGVVRLKSCNIRYAAPVT